MINHDILLPEVLWLAQYEFVVSELVVIVQCDFVIIYSAIIMEIQQQDDTSIGVTMWFTPGLCK